VSWSTDAPTSTAWPRSRTTCSGAPSLRGAEPPAVQQLSASRRCRCRRQPKGSRCRGRRGRLMKGLARHGGPPADRDRVRADLERESRGAATAGARSRRAASLRHQELRRQAEVNSSSDYYYLKQNLKDLLIARSVRRGDFVLASGSAPPSTSTPAHHHVRRRPRGDRRARSGPPGRVAGLPCRVEPHLARIPSPTPRRRARGRSLPLDAFTVRKQAKTPAREAIEGVSRRARRSSSSRTSSPPGARRRSHPCAVESEADRFSAPGRRGSAGRRREVLERAGYPVEALLTASELLG